MACAPLNHGKEVIVEISDGQFSGLQGAQDDELHAAIDPQEEYLDGDEREEQQESKGVDASDELSLEGELFVFTGTLQIKRAEAKALAERRMAPKWGPL